MRTFIPLRRCFGQCQAEAQDPRQPSIRLARTTPCSAGRGNFCDINPCCNERECCSARLASSHREMLTRPGADQCRWNAGIQGQDVWSVASGVFAQDFSFSKRHGVRFRFPRCIAIHSIHIAEIGIVENGRCPSLFLQTIHSAIEVDQHDDIDVLGAVRIALGFGQANGEIVANG